MRPPLNPRSDTIRTKTTTTTTTTNTPGTSSHPEDINPTHKRSHRHNAIAAILLGMPLSPDLLDDPLDILRPRHLRFRKFTQQDHVNNTLSQPSSSSPSSPSADAATDVKHGKTVRKPSTAGPLPTQCEGSDDPLSVLLGKLKIDGKEKVSTSKRRRWVSELTLEQTKLVEEALARLGTISEIPGASCTSGDLMKLRPKRWLNDEIINFYGMMINLRSISRSSSEEVRFLDLHCFSSFFITRYDLGQHRAVERWTKQIDLFTKDMIIFPINLNNRHWMCATINFRKKRFEVYDSLGGRHDSIFSKLRAYLETEHLHKRKSRLDLVQWSDYYHPNFPMQENSYDCGVFVCMYMDCLSRDREDDVIFDFGQGQIASGAFIPDEWDE